MGRLGVCVKTFRKALFVFQFSDLVLKLLFQNKDCMYGIKLPIMHGPVWKVPTVLAVILTES